MQTDTAIEGVNVGNHQSVLLGMSSARAGCWRLAIGAAYTFPAGAQDGKLQTSVNYNGTVAATCALSALTIVSNVLCARPTEDGYDRFRDIGVGASISPMPACATSLICGPAGWRTSARCARALRRIGRDLLCAEMLQGPPTSVSRPHRPPLGFRSSGCRDRCRGSTPPLGRSRPTMAPGSGIYSRMSRGWFLPLIPVELQWRAGSPSGGSRWRSDPASPPSLRR
jgi:hypothetical protein